MTKKVFGYCGHPFRQLRVSFNGYASLCCFQKRKCLGNILEEGLEAIWKKADIQDIRTCVSEGQLHPHCRAWGCPYNLKGRPIKMHEMEFSEECPRQLEIDLPNIHCNYGGEEPSETNQPCIMCARNFPAEVKKQTDDKWKWCAHGCALIFT